MSELIHDAEQILRDCFAGFAQFPNATLIDEPNAYGVITNLPITFFSGIATTRMDDEAEIDAIVDRYRTRNAMFRWWLTPSTRPANLEERLIARGFHHTYDANGMVADLANVDFDAPPPSELTIRRITTLDEFEWWLDAFMHGFGRPPEERGVWRDAYAFFGFEATSKWVHYVGFLDDQPVSTTSLLIAGDLGGIYQVATLPAARGRGIGRAVTLAAMKHARDLGAKRAVLQSSEMGYPVYRAIGFEDVCALRLYDWKPEYEK